MIFKYYPVITVKLRENDSTQWFWQIEKVSQIVLQARALSHKLDRPEISHNFLQIPSPSIFKLRLAKVKQEFYQSKARF